MGKAKYQHDGSVHETMPDFNEQSIVKQRKTSCKSNVWQNMKPPQIHAIPLQQDPSGPDPMARLLQLLSALPCEKLPAHHARHKEWTCVDHTCSGAPPAMEKYKKQKRYVTLSMLVLLLAKAHAVDTHMRLTMCYVWAPVAFCAVCCGHGMHAHFARAGLV